MPSERSTLVPVLLAVVGVLVLLAAPAMLFQPHYGQAAYDFSVEPVDRVPSDAQTVAFDNLSSGVQSTFLRGVSSDRPTTLWVDDLDANETVSALRAADYVRYDGGVYQVVRVSVDRFDPGPAVGRVLAVLGVTLLTLAGLMAYAETNRPLTPLRALWVPLAPVAVTGAIAAYDVYVTPPQSTDLPILVAATTWVVSGVYLRRRAFGLAVAAGVGALAVDALLTHPNRTLAVAGIVAYGVPWALLGATLAAPDDVEGPPDHDGAHAEAVAGPDREAETEAETGERAAP